MMEVTLKQHEEPWICEYEARHVPDDLQLHTCCTCAEAEAKEYRSEIADLKFRIASLEEK